MISSVRGTVLSALGSTVVVELGGVGLAVQVTPATALSARVGEETSLATTLVVREDSLTLYGFPTPAELAVFELLVGVTGVGPKSALGVLAVLSPDRIAQAVADDDDAAFRKVSGIGPKTAKLIVVSLAGKIAVAPPAPATPQAAESRSVGASVQAALVGLGWSERVAQEVVEETLADSTGTVALTVPAVLRIALSRLGPAASPAGRQAQEARR